MNDTPAEKTAPALKARLWVMMFLQYFVQGSYLPIVSLYLQDSLKFEAGQLGFFQAALAVGPLLAPFVVGQIVDRLWATERVLAACHLAAAGLMLSLYYQTQFTVILLLGTVYSVLYVPTLMLTNALTFHHLRDRAREFPMVRLWGTIGFVVPAWVIEMYWLRGLTGNELNQARGFALLLSSLAGFVMAGYCLTLPHTPPRRESTARFAPGAVLRLLVRPDFQVLVGVGFVIAMVHSYFFVWNSPYLKWFLLHGGIEGAYEQRISSIGQISEVAVFAGLGLAIVRVGFKATLTVGALAYLLRSLIFAAVPQLDVAYPLEMTLVCLGQALHGFCFGCFWATAFIYLDQVAPADLRGSTQTLYGTFLFGSGAFAGGLVAAGIGSFFSSGSDDNVVRDWSAIWLSSAALATVALVAFVALFPSRAAPIATPGPDEANRAAPSSSSSEP